MTEVQTSLSIQDPTIANGAVTTAIDDEAYLMTMVEADSLLPSNMTFSGLFEGENELNPDELSDIASLLAPQVSDDEAGGESVSSETNSPVSVRSATTTVTAAVAATEMPILPDLKAKTLALVTPHLSQKRTLVLQDTVPAPPLKKSKANGRKSSGSTTRNVALMPKPAPVGVPTPFSSLAKSSNTPNPLKAVDSNKRLPTSVLPALAPKPPTINSLPSLVIKKRADAKASAAIKSAVAPPTRAKVLPAKANAPIKPVTTTSAPPAAAKPLTDEERARQCRDRNRQHARNTRLRKKAYVEELKRQLREMVDQRDANLLQEAQKAKIVEQQREVRFQVMQDFLQLRGRNEGNPHRWGAILQEGFALTMPKTTFQTMVGTTSTMGLDAQTLHGVSDIMADSTQFASFLQSLPAATSSSDFRHTTGNDANIPITFVYHCDRSNFLMDGCNAFLDWTACSAGAVQAGAIRELELCGSMRARFCDQTNRLEQAEIQFDTGLVHNQLFV